MTDCDIDNIPLAILIIGYIGGFLIGIGPAFQLYKVIRSGNTQHISSKWFMIYGIGSIMALIFTSYILVLPILIPLSLEVLSVWGIIIIKIVHEKSWRKLCSKELATPDEGNVEENLPDQNE